MKVNKKVYISGKITDSEHFEKKFEDAEDKLKELGYTVINPVKLPHNHDKTWHSYMKEDIIELCKCDYIYRLDDWKYSRGAQIEYNLAIMLGIDDLKLLLPKPSDQQNQK